MQELSTVINKKTKLVALVHVSNMLGSLLDTDYVAELSHKVAFLNTSI